LQYKHLSILISAGPFSHIDKKENGSRSRTGSAVRSARSRPRCRHPSMAMSKPTNTTAVSLSQCGSPATANPPTASFTSAPRTTPPPDAEPGRSSTWTTPRRRGRSRDPSPCTLSRIAAPSGRQSRQTRETSPARVKMAFASVGRVQPPRYGPQEGTKLPRTPVARQNRDSVRVCFGSPARTREVTLPGDLVMRPSIARRAAARRLQQQGRRV